MIKKKKKKKKKVFTFLNTEDQKYELHEHNKQNRLNFFYEKYINLLSPADTRKPPLKQTCPT